MTDQRTLLFTVILETLREYGAGLSAVQAIGVLEEVKAELLVAALRLEPPVDCLEPTP